MAQNNTAKKDKTELFERMPVASAIVLLAIPTIISQIIHVVYSIADTFFIGQLNDPNQVAAATLIMPPFLLLAAISNLFGIGGASLISRSLGAGDREKARRCAAFCMWSAAGVAFIYGLAMFLFRSTIFPILGSDEYTYGYCTAYALWTLAIGAVPTVLNPCLAHMVRAEGYSKEASFGVAMGGILNMALDPLFIFPLGMGVAGAAIATMLSNLAATVYFIILIMKKRDVMTIRFSPRNYTVKGGIPKEVLLVGLPSCLLMLMSTLSNTILNKLVVSYSNQTIAGMGIGKKIDTFAFAFTNGMTQGVLPLIGYNYASGDHERMRKAARLSFLFAFGLAAASAVFLFTCAVPLVRAFIDDAATVAYGQHVLKIICVTVPCTSVTMMIITMFQATGQKVKPMLVSLMRKGCLDIPFMFLMDHLYGADGIPFATPIADVLAMIIAAAVFIPYWRKIGKTL